MYSCDRPWQGRALILLMVLISALAGGCVSSSRVAELVRAPDEAVVTEALSGRVLHFSAQEFELPSQQYILSLTPAMEAFAEQAVAGISRDAQKVEALHHALVSPVIAGGLGIRYNSQMTLAPTDVFSQREANCLSFSLLFTLMARHIGLNAFINDVAVPPAWNLANNRVLYMRHVNAKVDLRYSRDDLVVDLDMRNFRTYYTQKRIDDSVAVAQFYNNLSMTLAPGDATLIARFAYLQAALLLAPDQSYLWNNLAVLYSQQSQYALAEQLYLKALALDPEDLTALLNLSEHYRYLGNDLLYQQLSDLAQSYRDVNPYYQYRLAGELYDNASYQLAAVKIESAIRRQPQEKRFYRLAADIYESLGNDDKRRRALANL